MTARKYWNKLKQRLGEEGSQLVTNCHQLKLTAADGKERLTDCATAETLLRLVQSVPNPCTCTCNHYSLLLAHYSLLFLSSPSAPSKSHKPLKINAKSPKNTLHMYFPQLPIIKSGSKKQILVPETSTHAAHPSPTQSQQRNPFHPRTLEQKVRGRGTLDLI